ncbi:hypothetical protein KKA47_00900, partial [bacterium]|nr:hypothetical protein [bacterium]
KSPIRGEVAMASAYDLIAINLGEIRDFEATAAIYRKNSILSRRLGSSEEGVSYLINAARSELARNNFLAAAAYVAEAKEIAERNDLPVDSLVSLKGKIEEKFGGKIDIAGSLIDRLENKIRGDRTIQSAEDMLKVRNTTPNMLGILRRAAASYLLANEPELRYQALMRYGQFAEPEEAQAKYLEAADIIRQHRLWGKGDPQKLLMMELEALYARAYSLAKLNNPNAKPKAPAITNGPHFDVIIANNKRRTEVRNMYEDVRLWIRDYKGDVLIPQAIGDSALAVEIRNTLSAAAGMSTGLTPEAALELTKVVREDFEKGADGRAEIPVAGTDPAAESPRVEVGVVGRPELPKDVMIRGNEGEPQRMVRFREKFGRAIDAFLQSKDPEQLKMALNIMRRHPELGGAGLTETHLLDALEGRYPELAARLESWCWKGFSRFPGDNVARVIREVQQGQKGKVGRRDGRDRDRPHPIGK